MTLRMHITAVLTGKETLAADVYSRTAQQGWPRSEQAIAPTFCQHLPKPNSGCVDFGRTGPV